MIFTVYDKDFKHDFVENARPEDDDFKYPGDKAGYLRSLELINEAVKNLTLPPQLFLEPSSRMFAPSLPPLPYDYFSFDEEFTEFCNNNKNFNNFQLKKEIRFAYASTPTPEEEEHYYSYAHLRTKVWQFINDSLGDQKNRKQLEDFEALFKAIRELGSNEKLFRFNLVWRSRNRHDIGIYVYLIYDRVHHAHRDLRILRGVKQIFEEYMEELQADRREDDDFVYKDTPGEARIASNEQTARGLVQDTYDAIGSVHFHF